MDTDLKTARAILRAGDYRRAERILRALEPETAQRPAHEHLLGVALLGLGRPAAAIDILERATTAAPELAAARVDLARAYRAAGRHSDAHAAVRGVLARFPSMAPAWMALGDVLVELGQYPDARAAFRRAQAADPRARALAQARNQFRAGDPTSAEQGFRQILREDASHVGALCGLAAVSLGAGAASDAQRLLAHALHQTSHSPLVWRLLAQAHLENGQLLEADAAIARALLVEPESAQSWTVRATICGRLMRPELALEAYRESERLDPKQPLIHLSIGHVFKSLGRRADCERVYHECIEREPSSGEAYWSLADLKTYRFTDRERDDLAGQLGVADLDDGNAALLNFALARALEQRADFDGAFRHYAAGNRLRRQRVPFDIDAFEAKSRRIASRMNEQFFSSRRGAGRRDPAPIFIVGLPRSGSTLVEQILASHPAVEGTMELPNLPSLVRELDGLGANNDAYPESLLPASSGVLKAFGERYIAETAALRTGRPHFIDKLPNNFSHIGFIHSILPDARIIDVRRDPMDACLSCFKQYFAAGQAFTYDLEILGRYYRCYLDLMEHWHAVLSGRVFTLSYEELVKSPDRTIRRLLEYCGLEFDERCTNFHETQRPIRTASSEQVRLPLYDSGVGYWRAFAGHLEPLRQSLGDCVERFRVGSL